MSIFNKNFFNNIIIVTIIMILVSGFIIDLYFKHEEEERNLIKVQENVKKLKDAFGVNLTRIAQNNMYTSKSYLSVKRLLETVLINSIDQHELGNKRSCGEIVTRLSDIKSSYEYLNIRDEDKDLFYKTLKKMRITHQDDTEKVGDLLYIDSCFTRKQ